MKSGELFAGLDLGTSSLKGVVIDAAGMLVASAQASYPTHRPSPERAEQSAADWIAATSAVLRHLSEKAPAERWLVLGLSGMIPTLVTLDSVGNPIGPAISWEDARAEVEGQALRDAIGPDRLYRMTGQWVDGRYLLPMFAWLRRWDPERAASVALICGAKDYMYAYLTGDMATDASTASGYGCHELSTGTWSGEIAESAGVPLTALPKIVPSTTTSPIRPELARALRLPESLSVCVGAADSVLGALGLGVTEPGQVACVAGTSTVILEVSDRVHFDGAHRYLITPLATPDRWGFEMDLLSTGSAMQWLAGVMGLAGGVPALLGLAARSVPGANGVTFLPYLSSGEQGALWDATLRGAILGLTLGHGQQDLARALVEGIAFETRRCVEVLNEAGAPVREITAAGMGATSPQWWQLLADVARCVVTVPAANSGLVSAFGAALIGAQAAGADAGSMRAGAPAERFHPDQQSASLWADIIRRHDHGLAMISGSRQ